MTRPAVLAKRGGRGAPALLALGLCGLALLTGCGKYAPPKRVSSGTGTAAAAQTGAAEDACEDPEAKPGQP